MTNILCCIHFQLTNANYLCIKNQKNYFYLLRIKRGLMILDKFLGFWIKNCDSGHCETESRGAQQQNRLLESSKILKEQSSKHFLEQTSCFYVCQMNNKHCYAQVCRLGINHWRVKAFLFHKKCQMTHPLIWEVLRKSVLSVPMVFFY